VVVHLRDRHARTHQVLTNWDFVEVRRWHLMCSLNDGKVIWDLDWRMLGSLQWDWVLVAPNCPARVALTLSIDSLKVLKYLRQLTDVTAALHASQNRMAFATNVMLMLIDLMLLVYLNL
jgi:hypothetical protein